MTASAHKAKINFKLESQIQFTNKPGNQTGRRNRPIRVSKREGKVKSQMSSIVQSAHGSIQDLF
jgi:hypothetical protein